jgi:hypothetical protein
MLYEDELGTAQAADGAASAASQTTATDGSGQSSDHPSSPPPIFHPLAYRGVVASWPTDWRERWGRRANELEDSGLPWRDAETQAFVELWNQLRQRPSAEPPAVAPVEVPEVPAQVPVG